MRCIFKGNREGFTLIEVVVAIAILGVGMVTLAQVISGGLRSADISRKYVRAVTYAQSKLGEISLYPEIVQGEESGEFTDSGGYVWETTVSPYKEDKDGNVILYRIDVRVIFSELNGNKRKVELSTLRVARKGDIVV